MNWLNVTKCYISASKGFLRLFTYARMSFYECSRRNLKRVLFILISVKRVTNINENINKKVNSSITTLHETVTWHITENCQKVRFFISRTFMQVSFSVRIFRLKAMDYLQDVPFILRSFRSDKPKQSYHLHPNQHSRQFLVINGKQPVSQISMSLTKKIIWFIFGQLSLLFLGCCSLMITKRYHSLHKVLAGCIYRCITSRSSLCLWSVLSSWKRR